MVAAIERKHSPGQLPTEVRGQREAAGGSLFYLEEGRQETTIH
jgi:hypothetical protein